jgi:phosphate acyltransferase
MRIAVDAMGGDVGPTVTVEGAVAAARELRVEVVLVGDKATVERELARHRTGDLPITVRHASQVVGMDESPTQALRRKRDSSLRVAAELVRDGEAGAFVSAGNTGAAMAIAMFTLGRAWIAPRSWWCCPTSRAGRFSSTPEPTSIPSRSTWCSTR